MLYDILNAINPLITRENVICQNDGLGEYIAKWDASLGPQPTQAQIDAARPLAEAALIKEQTKATIAQLEASQHRAIRENALGQPGANARLAELDARIVALRASIWSSNSVMILRGIAIK